MAWRRAGWQRLFTVLLLVFVLADGFLGVLLPVQIPEVRADPDVASVQLWVDGFTNRVSDGWDKIGSSPYLDAQDQPNNYINSTASNKDIGDFTFDDLPSNAVSVVNVTLYVYLKTFPFAGKVQIYVWNGSWQQIGTLASYNAWNWKTLDLSSVLDTVDEVNNAKIYINSYTYGSYGQCVDAAYLLVYYEKTPSSSVNSALYYVYQRKTFYAAGRFWVFYSDGNNIVYASRDADSQSWKAPVIIGEGDIGRNIAVDYNGSHLVYVYKNYSDGTLWFRMGEPYPDGTITWNDEHQKIVDCVVMGISVAFDSNGYVWVGYANGSDSYKPYVIKSDWKNGTWHTASGFPHKLNDVAATILQPWAVAFSPLENGEVLAVCAKKDEKIKGYLYNGSWSNEETLSNNTIVQRFAFSVTQDDNITYIIYRDTADVTFLIKRFENGTLSQELEIMNLDSYASLSIDYISDIITVSYINGTQLYYRLIYPNGTLSSPKKLVNSNVASNFLISSFRVSLSGMVTIAWFNTTDSTKYLHVDYVFFGAAKTYVMTNNYRATCYGFQRKGFYDENCDRYWVFYSDGEYICYVSSKDLIHWTEPTKVEKGNIGGYFSLYFNGSHVAYVFNNLTTDTPLIFRMGTPLSNGSINWLPRTTVQPAYPDMTYKWLTVAIDKYGFPWVGYTTYNTTTSEYYPFITKSDWKNGTWHHAEGFPYQLSTESHTFWTVNPQPLDNGNVYVIYLHDGTVNRGKIYYTSNSSWSAEETYLESFDIECNTRHSVTVIGNDIYFVENTEQGTITAIKRTWGQGWGQPQNITEHDPSVHIAPQVSRCGSIPYCFFVDEDWTIKLSRWNGTTWTQPETIENIIIDKMSGGYESSSFIYVIKEFVYIGVLGRCPPAAISVVRLWAPPPEPTNIGVDGAPHPNNQVIFHAFWTGNYLDYAVFYWNASGSMTQNGTLDWTDNPTEAWSNFTRTLPDVQVIAWYIVAYDVYGNKGNTTVQILVLAEWHVLVYDFSLNTRKWSELAFNFTLDVLQWHSMTFPFDLSALAWHWLTFPFNLECMQWHILSYAFDLVSKAWHSLTFLFQLVALQWHQLLYVYDLSVYGWHQLTFPFTVDAMQWNKLLYDFAAQTRQWNTLGFPFTLLKWGEWHSLAYLFNLQTLQWHELAYFFNLTVLQWHHTIYPFTLNTMQWNSLNYIFQAITKMWHQLTFPFMLLPWQMWHRLIYPFEVFIPGSVPLVPPGQPWYADTRLVLMFAFCLFFAGFLMKKLMLD